MRTNRWILIPCIIAMLILVQLSCDLGSVVPEVEIPGQEDGQASQPEPTAVTVQQEPTPPFDVPDPQAGTGNVLGRIVWNEAPVAGTEVQLCEDFGMFSGCEGVNFLTTTDPDGYYLFTNIPPGEFALAVHAIDSDTWLYVTEGLGFGANKYLIEADNTLTIGSQSIYKFDLVQVSPLDDAQIQEGQPELTWEPYPGAAYYEVYLSPERGSAVFVSDEAEEPQITPPVPLLNCEYTWQIEAYNAGDQKIAEHDGYWHFIVSGQEYSCNIVLNSPKDGAVVAAQGLELSWEEHPLATSYRVHIWDKDYTDILDGPLVNGTGYTVDLVIPSGAYQWYITAYDSGDNEIARSDFYKFTVP